VHSRPPLPLRLLSHVHLLGLRVSWGRGLGDGGLRRWHRWSYTGCRHAHLGQRQLGVKRSWGAREQLGVNTRRRRCSSQLQATVKRQLGGREERRKIADLCLRRAYASMQPWTHKANMTQQPLLCRPQCGPAPCVQQAAQQAPPAVFTEGEAWVVRAPLASGRAVPLGAGNHARPRAAAVPCEGLWLTVCSFCLA